MPQNGRGYEFQLPPNDRIRLGLVGASWQVWPRLRICGLGGMNMRSMVVRYCIVDRCKMWSELSIADDKRLFGVWLLVIEMVSRVGGVTFTPCLHIYITF